MTNIIDVTIIGGGMITHDLILPAVYQLQRTGVVGAIDICSLNNPPLKFLAESQDLKAAFPNQTFTPHPALSEPEDKNCPDLYKEVLAAMKPRQMAVVAMPDQLHYPVVMEALAANQNVLCVKPLVLKYEQAEEIEKIAKEKGLFVGVEYHKRFDRRSLLARKEYRQGLFGEFKMGEAKMIEPYFYRSSNFQNWFTCDKTDPFVYVGCHYVDLVYFITGLKPVEVSVQGVKDKFPNGNEGYMWANGRVTWENGAILSVIDGLGYPDLGAGSNDQGIMLLCEGDGKGGMIRHDDQYRGTMYSYLDGVGCGGSNYNYVNPDFFRMIPWEGVGYKPIGYGPESVSASIQAARRMEELASQYPDEEVAMEVRQSFIEQVDGRGLIATPANSSINELVVEAARMSILADGMPVKIVYEGTPHVEMR